MFVAEIGVDILAEEFEIFWKSWSNRIDTFVCFLCVILFIVYASLEDAPDTHHSVESYIDAIVVGIRYGIQAVRLMRFAHKLFETLFLFLFFIARHFSQRT